MIASDTLLFLHLHKSGGTFVNELLLNCEPSARRIGYHLPYAAAPAELRNLPVLGTVRNPFEYYVSWYFFQRRQERPNALFRLCSADGTRDFAATIAAMQRLGEDEDMLARLRATLPETFGRAGLNLTRSCSDGLRGFPGGFYSFLHQRLYAGTEDATILRTDRIRPTILATLAGLGCTRMDRMQLFLDRVPDLNRSTHGHHRDYYDDTLRRLIAQRDAALIDHYAFAF